MSRTNVTDLSPLHTFTALTYLNIQGTNTKATDLSVLRSCSASKHIGQLFRRYTPASE